MRKNSLVFFALFAFSIAQAQSDTLTNESIVKLHQSGFSSEVLKSKITNTPAKFDVSINALMKLKDNKVPEDVINLMIGSPNGSATIRTSPQSSGGGSSQASNVSTGIFYIKSATEIVEMNPSFIVSKKTDKTIHLLTTLADADIRVILNEPKAALEVPSLPKFQFVFDTLRSNNENPYFGKNSSPKNFFLVKLKPTKKTRDLVVGTTSAVSENIEIKERQKIPMKNKKTGPGVYEVSPVSPLEPGEYGIIFSNATWDSQSGKIYDFSVKK